MTELTLDEVVDDRLGPLTLRCSVGLTVLVADQRPALVRLMDIAAGARRPRRGRVSLDGDDLHASPAARRKLGALLEHEELVPRPSVRESVALALSLRKPGGDAEALLREWGLGRLLAAKPQRLEAAERRAVALCVALATPEASALVLCDPFALAALVDPARIRDACFRAAERALVLVGTASLDDATSLGGELTLLLRGRVADATQYARGLAHETLLRSNDAARLAELLRRDAALEVSFDAARSPRELFIRGPSQAQICERVLRVVRDEDLALDALTPISRLAVLP